MIETLIQLLWCLLIFFFGASMGSWLYVLAERLPHHETTIWKRSYCSNCHTPLAVRSLIPIVSWIVQKGRCLTCHNRISMMYILIEIVTAMGTLLIVRFYSHDYGLSSLLNPQTINRSVLFNFLTALWLFYSAIPLLFTDLRYLILPDEITLPGIIVSLVLGSFNPSIGWFQSLTGAILGGGLFWFTAWSYQKIRHHEGLGLGDVKYMALLGGVIGFQHLFWVFFLSCFFGTIVGVIKGLITGEGLKAMIPFGPFLSLGALIVHFSKTFL